MSLVKKIITKGKKLLKEYLKPLWNQAKNLKTLGNYSTDQPTELELIALVDKYITEGNRCLNLEKTATAIDYYQKALAICPGHGRAFFLLGIALIECNNIDAAKDAFCNSAKFLERKETELIWGTIPLINNKYLSNAMSDAGWKSKTLVTHYYSVYKREDFDIYFEDLIPTWLTNEILKTRLSPYFAMLYILEHASVMFMSFSGGALGSTPLWNFESQLLQQAGIKTVLASYGGDAWLYSKILNPCLRHVLLADYPQAGKSEPSISTKVTYWQENADIVVFGVVDGISRWNLLPVNYVCIDESQWQPKKHYSQNNGINGVVRIIHTPNHRAVKGTEFLLHAVEQLRIEGLQIDLMLLEGVSNERVRELMQEADILAEQFIMRYGLSGIEGMASGLPVMSALEFEVYTRLLRRYSHLDECPVVSTTPENLITNLRTLIKNPELREKLGVAGRQYVEKYHSRQTVQYMFGAICDKLIHEKDINLMNLFHPLLSSYNKSSPYVSHPLIENNLPKEYLEY
jgi:hypothetical protein